MFYKVAIDAELATVTICVDKVDADTHSGHRLKS